MFFSFYYTYILIESTNVLHTFHKSYTVLGAKINTLNQKTKLLSMNLQSVKRRQFIKKKKIQHIRSLIVLRENNFNIENFWIWRDKYQFMIESLRKKQKPKLHGTVTTEYKSSEKRLSHVVIQVSRALQRGCTATGKLLSLVE